MRYFLALLLIASPAMACDWKVSERVDPMTDGKVCTITSPSAHLGIGVRGDVVTFVSSGYRYGYDYLTLRVDDHKAIQLGKRARSTNAYESEARDALALIRSGQRMRVQFRTHNGTVNGEAASCNLSALSDACAN